MAVGFFLNITYWKNAITIYCTISTANINRSTNPRVRPIVQSMCPKVSLNIELLNAS